MWAPLGQASLVTAHTAPPTIARSPCWNPRATSYAIASQPWQLVLCPQLLQLFIRCHRVGKIIGQCHRAHQEQGHQGDAHATIISTAIMLRSRS